MEIQLPFVSQAWNAYVHFRITVYSKYPPGPKVYDKVRDMKSRSGVQVTFSAADERGL